MKKNIDNIGIITGSAGIIGSAIAKQLSFQFEKLIIVDINETKLFELKKNIQLTSSIQCEAYYCDVSNSNSVNEILEKAISDIGSPNILINCAGIGGPFHKVVDVSDEEWFKIINTNLKSVFNLSRALLPGMKKQKYGKIINIASIQGYVGAAHSSTYVASKHGVIGYTKAIAAEWGIHGITCNAICPGYVNTSMGTQNDKIKDHYKKVIEKTPLSRIAEPEEIANLVSYLTNDASNFMNGSILTIDGGLTCHLGVS